MITLSSLTLAYDKKGKKILQNINFSLEKGQIGVLLGPNGAGKSTLLKATVGLLKPLHGQIQIDGVSLHNMKPRERAKRIAYVPQILDFEPSRVYDVVMLGRLPYFELSPSKKDHEVVTKVLEDLGLSDLKERNIVSLSGGERQKIAIARALAQESDIVVFDEPTSNLDITSEALIAKQVQELAKKYGKSVLLAVHDLTLAYRLGDRFLFLKEGKAIAMGDHQVFDEEAVEATFDIEVKKFVSEEGTIFITKGESL